MARFTPVKIQTLELAALAFAAYRKNNNHVYKDVSFYDTKTETVISVVPNKSLMRSDELTVTDEDRKAAAEAIDLLSKDRTMRILKNLPVADFLNTLTNLVIQSDSTMSDAGLMAFLPNAANQIRERQSQEEKTAVIAQTSQYLGKVGDKVTVELTVMNQRFLQQYNCWSVTGHDTNGNLINFLTSKKECTVSGQYTAKIKRVEESRYHNGAKVTQLNFVKAI